MSREERDEGQRYINEQRKMLTLDKIELEAADPPDYEEIQLIANYLEVLDKFDEYSGEEKCLFVLKHVPTRIANMLSKNARKIDPLAAGAQHPSWDDQEAGAAAAPLVILESEADKLILDALLYHEEEVEMVVSLLHAFTADYEAILTERSELVRRCRAAASDCWGFGLEPFNEFNALELKAASSSDGRRRKRSAPPTDEGSLRNGARPDGSRLEREYSPDLFATLPFPAAAAAAAEYDGETIGDEGRTPTPRFFSPSDATL